MKAETIFNLCSSIALRRGSLKFPFISVMGFRKMILSATEHRYTNMSSSFSTVVINTWSPVTFSSS